MMMDGRIGLIWKCVMGDPEMLTMRERLGLPPGVD
jgi:hypothetical protein